jgi:DnaK suppressor protein
MTKADIERMASLRQLLLDRQHHLQGDVLDRVRTNRVSRARDVGDSLDTSDEDVQVGMDLTLLQIKTTTLAAIADALRRLDAGRYGDCTECGESIPEARLRAVPFAVRCQSCEHEREVAHRQRRVAVEDSFGTDAPHALRSLSGRGSGRPGA